MVYDCRTRSQALPAPYPSHGSRPTDDNLPNHVPSLPQRTTVTAINHTLKKKLYEFKGWKSSISSCVSSPALDVVAIGCTDGTIHVYNIRYDEQLVRFTHSTRGAVTALSFSTGMSHNMALLT